MIPNVVAVLNGKGGVGKTSLAANMAGLAALSGWSTLAVDLDPQGNLAHDLGYENLTDGGLSLAEACGIEPKEVQVHCDVEGRRGLDVIAGGPHLQTLGDTLGGATARGDDDALGRLGAGD